MDMNGYDRLGLADGELWVFLSAMMITSHIPTKTMNDALLG